jgi:cytochrome c peroxidase
LPLLAPEQEDPATIARGRTLFESSETACVSCHEGAQLGGNALKDVGTGGAFKIPSLQGVALRLPLMHTGCAETLEQRFDPACGGAEHGKTSHLNAAQLADLVAYLRSL